MDKKELLEIIKEASETKRQELKLWSQGIKELPPEIGQLTNLEVLFLNGNELTSLPPEIGQLTNLNELHLWSNNLSSLPMEIGKLKNLTVLNLYDNQLSSLPKEIGQLTSLTKLDLHNNQLSSLPTEIGQLTNLNILYLWTNGLSSLPMEIGKLKNLKMLDLRSNRLVSIPSEIGQLTNLNDLDLSNNQLISVPTEIGGLTKLTSLYLSGNQLSSMTPDIINLTNLINLSLSYNHLISMPIGIKGLKNLKRLTLQGNPIRELPEFILELNLEIIYKRDIWPSEGQISLWDNPLEIPPVEIVIQGNKAIRNYFDSIRQEKEKGIEEFRLYEAKLLVVGRGDVGKTWLAHRLVTGRLPEKDGTTRGIDIHIWQFNAGDIKNFRANLWDFGGQEILHSTHQFFLTRRSLYLFVWEARTDDDQTAFDYWLNIIKLLSDSSPVIIAMNKCDERIKNIDEQTYEKNFNILGFYKVSAKENMGIDELRKHLQCEMVKLPHIGTPLPQVWMKIRKRLEYLKRPYISYKEYLGICTEYGLDRTQADLLSGYYHNVGVILHFQENPILQDTVFLQPEWVTEAVYCVIENFEVQKKNGWFKYEQLAKILDVQRYPIEIHHKLLELMKKFELCFEIEGENEYIIPELLKGDRPSFEWDYQNNLQFEYEYKFMPVGIITRFIVRVHELHKDELYWKSGVIIDWEGHTQALVISESINRKIRIWIRGQDAKGLLAIIRYHIGYIHKTLNKPEAEQMLPCICEQCRQSNDPYFHKYHELLAVQKKGKDARCNKSAEDISIDKLFGKYGIEKESDSEMGKPVDKLKIAFHKEPWYKKVHPVVAIIVGIIAMFGFITGVKSCPELIDKKLMSPSAGPPNMASDSKSTIDPNKVNGNKPIKSLSGN